MPLSHAALAARTHPPSAHHTVSGSILRWGGRSPPPCGEGVTLGPILSAGPGVRHQKKIGRALAVISPITVPVVGSTSLSTTS